MGFSEIFFDLSNQGASNPITKVFKIVVPKFLLLLNSFKMLWRKNAKFITQSSLHMFRASLKKLDCNNEKWRNFQSHLDKVIKINAIFKLMQSKIIKNGVIFKLIWPKQSNMQVLCKIPILCIFCQKGRNMQKHMQYAIAQICQPQLLLISRASKSMQIFTVKYVIKYAGKRPKYAL